MKILVTGGTVFVSKYTAEYFVKRGDEVFVLNRGRHSQIKGVTLIEGDRNHLDGQLGHSFFDAVIDVTAYTSKDVDNLLDSGVSFRNYILISSSAVYPESAQQPFSEETPLGPNQFWGAYGTGKTEAEAALAKRVSNAYILRPPYLYGPYNNVYREAFVFDCAAKSRKFYLPKDGEMKLQFFHVEDLCRFIDILLEKEPQQHIFNVGNETSVSIREWAALCYRTVGKEASFVSVNADIPQRKYFSFYDYEYFLNVQKQRQYLPETKPLAEGLQEAYLWYMQNTDSVNRKPYFAFIDENL